MADKEEIRNQAESVIRDRLTEKADTAIDTYVQNEGFEHRYIDGTVVEGKIVDALLESAVDEFMEFYPKTTEGTVIDDAREYVDENYDEGFMTNQVEHFVDEDSIRENMADDLVLTVENTDPYGNVDNSTYWRNAANRVQNLGEMQTYINGDVAIFVERYAPDWEEVSDQSKK